LSARFSTTRFVRHCPRGGNELCRQGVYCGISCNTLRVRGSSMAGSRGPAGVLLRTAVAAVGSRGPAVAQVSHMLTSSCAQHLRHRLWLAAPAQVSHIASEPGAASAITQRARTLVAASFSYHSQKQSLNSQAVAAEWFVDRTCVDPCKRARNPLYSSAAQRTPAKRRGHCATALARKAWNALVFAV
jgi:hypothetical protein